MCIRRSEMLGATRGARDRSSGFEAWVREFTESYCNLAILECKNNNNHRRNEILGSM